MQVARAVVAGIVEYPEAIEVMDRLRDDRISDVAQDTILFLQHPEIVTMGPRARKEGVTAEGYSTVDVDRGRPDLAWAWPTCHLPNNQVGRE